MAFLISLAQFIFNLSTAMKGNPGEKREGCQTSRYGTIAISQTDGIKKTHHRDEFILLEAIFTTLC